MNLKEKRQQGTGYFLGDIFTEEELGILLSLFD